MNPFSCNEMMRSLPGTVCILSAPCAPPPHDDLSIRGATVVDVTDVSLAANQAVLVLGHRIVAVGPADAVTIPQGTEVLEAAGGLLIPGLWDAHVQPNRKPVSRRLCGA